MAISSQIRIQVLTRGFGSSIPTFVVFMQILTSWLWLDRIMIFLFVLSLTLREFPAFCICILLRVVFYARNCINAPSKFISKCLQLHLFSLHLRSRDITENYFKRIHYHADLTNLNRNFKSSFILILTTVVYKIS